MGQKRSKGGIFKMKSKIFLALVLFLVGVSIVSAAYEESLPASDLDKTDESKKSLLYYSYDSKGLNPMVKLVSLRYEPYPVEPGSHFDVWLKIENIGKEAAEDVRIAFVPKGQFSIDGDAEKKIGYLGSRQTTVVKFEDIKASEDAVEGINQLEFKINMGGTFSEVSMSSKVDIEIQSVEPLFDITVESEPNKISQGGVADIKVTLQNKDSATLRDITVQLDLPDDIVPVGSTVLKKIQKISPGDEKSLIYKVTASVDTTSKAYQIPLTVTYSDETGTTHTQDDVMGLLIGAEPDYDLNLEDSDTFSEGRKGQIVLSVSNTGPADIKFMTMELLPSDDFVIISNSKTYLGNLEPDDYETAEFKIYTKREGDIPLKVKINYRDNYNEKHEDIHQLKLHSYTPKELSMYGFGDSSNPLVRTIFYVLATIFVYLTYKNWKRDKDIVKAGKHSLAIMVRSFFRFLTKIRWRYIKRIPRKIKLFLYAEDH